MSIALGMIAGTVCGAFAHELGHAIAARFAGFRVRTFSIGTGPVLFNRKFGNTQIIIRLLAMSGYVQPDASTAALSWPYRFYLLAGPLANMALAAFAWSVGYGQYDNMGRFWWGFGAIQIYDVLINLHPRDTRAGGLPTSTDGKKLLLSLRGIDPDADAWQRFIDQAIQHYNVGDAELDKVSPARQRIYAHMRQIGATPGDGRTAATYEFIRSEITANEISVPERLYLTDFVVTSWLLREPESRLREMDELTASARALAPNSSDLSRTRSGVLVELGLYEEARVLLEREDLQLGSPLDQILNCYYRARVAEALGNLELAQKLAAKAAQWEATDGPTDAYGSVARTRAAALLQRLNRTGYRLLY